MVYITQCIIYTIRYTLYITQCIIYVKQCTYNMYYVIYESRTKRFKICSKKCNIVRTITANSLILVTPIYIFMLWHFVRNHCRHVVFPSDTLFGFNCYYI